MQNNMRNLSRHWQTGADWTLSVTFLRIEKRPLVTFRSPLRSHSKQLQNTSRFFWEQTLSQGNNRVCSHSILSQQIFLLWRKRCSLHCREVVETIEVAAPLLANSLEWFNRNIRWKNNLKSYTLKNHGAYKYKSRHYLSPRASARHHHHAHCVDGDASAGCRRSHCSAQEKKGPGK